MPRGSGSRSRSSSRSRSTAKKQTPSSRKGSVSKSPARKTPSKSPARTPAKTPSKSPGRKASSASITSTTSTSSVRRGRPPGSGKKEPLATSTPKTPKRSSSVSSSVSRASSASRVAPAERAALRVRTHAMTATPRAASPRGRDNGQSLGCKYNNAICSFAKESWGGFKDGFTRRQLTRRDKERRNRVWKVIFILAFAAFIYYTYMYKFVYYRQAYGYAQGYMDAARDFVNKKTK